MLPQARSRSLLRVNWTATASKLDETVRPKGISLTFASHPGFKLHLQGLERRQSGIELLNARTVEGVMYATVFVPEGKVPLFVRMFESYATEDTKKGAPKNKKLAESITTVRLAALESYWTDAGKFPTNRDLARWWEVWLRDVTNPHDVTDQFRQMAAAAGIEVSSREIRFPERRVLLAKASTEQLTSVSNLFDVLAEIRLAKVLAGTFIEATPREQAQWVEEARTRIQPPPTDAPVVCHLDSGVNRGHPLLEFALPVEAALACDPSWSAADSHPHQHGTGMAGIALYGCLTEVFSSNEPLVLRHGLESVKVYDPAKPHDPDLYGHVTQQSVSIARIAAPERQRVVCLTITTDGRDEGFPSSWSGAIDDLSAGVLDSPRQLVIVSAGNVRPEDRHQYPEQNQVDGVEDPAQAWNAVSVGAFTDKVTIETDGYDEWKPVAQERGVLSPSSRTSIIWADKTWPLKPDVVFEGGNDAIDPSTKRADHVEDLALLTTHISPTGALLTSTGDTSAAAALASRFAATIYARYPHFQPETVRALMIHSARWTDAMEKQFDRKDRLRVYGYGVPDISLALWSTEGCATVIIEDALQPFDREGTAQPKSKDMKLHDLPWPREVLQELEDIEIRMRITLSYFIEPSPGRRGWTRKHRYQSHGLRFDALRPLETADDFLKRLSKAARDEDDDDFAGGTDSRKWQLGDHLRRKGSIHSDVWTGTAAELAASGQVAVFPVTGWWKERPHLGKWNDDARYSLVISLETDAQDVDLYTPIATQIGVPVEIITDV